jgi:hypothetical protein
MKIKEFAQAQTKAVGGNLPSGGWPVYEKYEIVGDEHTGNFVYASPPPLNLKETAAREGLPNTRGWDYSMIDWGIREVYFPLKLDGLFLEFAELVENGPIDAWVVLDWAERYGLLDEPWNFVLTSTTERSDEEEPVWMREYGTDRLQSVYEFFLAAKEANRCLRLYEAATAENGPDLKTLKLYRIEHDEPDKMSRAALREAMEIVQRNLEAYCYPKLYYNKNTGHPLTETGWGFRNLRGALYIQMARLLTAPPENIRRCAYPGCTRTIGLEREPDESSPPSRSTKKNDRSKGYKTREDKKYCSPKHRYKYYNEYIRPQRGSKDGPRR